MDINHKIFKLDDKTMITKRIIDLIKNKPFYGHILGQLNKIFVKNNPDLPTFAVGKRLDEFVVKLYINTDFIKNLKERASNSDQFNIWIDGILEHEILHIVLGHLSLGPSLPDAALRGLAVDCSVNSWIDRSRLPKDCIWPEQFKLEPKKSVQYYYENLPKTEAYQKMKADREKWEKIVDDLIKSHANWEEIAKDPKTPDIIRNIIKKSKEACNGMYGSMPGDLLESIDKASKRKKPQIPWKSVLRQFVASCSESNLIYTDKKISKRYGIRPGTKKDEICRIAVAYDTSGSITNEALAVFQNEIHWIYKNGASIRVYEADTEIQREFEYTGKHLIDAKGRGGTAFEPVLKEVERKFDGLIYFTDFDGKPVSRKYNIPTLWVINKHIVSINTPDSPYKWGKHLEIKVG